MLQRGSVYLVSILRKEHLPISFWGATPTLLFPPLTSQPPPNHPQSLACAFGELL